jgi:hypothetical protein
MENTTQKKAPQSFNLKPVIRFPEPVSIPREAIEAFVRVFQNIADFHKEEKLEQVKSQIAVDTKCDDSKEYFDNLKNKFQTLLKEMSFQDFESFDLSIDTSVYISRLLALVQNPKGRNIDDWEVYLERLLRKGQEDGSVEESCQEHAIEPKLVEIEWFRSFEEAFEAAKEGVLISNEHLWKEFKFLYWVDGSTFKINRGTLLNVFPLNTTCIYQPHMDMGVLAALESEEGAVLGLECFQAESLFCEDFFLKAWFKLTPEIINLDLADNIKIPLK